MNSQGDYAILLTSGEAMLPSVEELHDKFPGIEWKIVEKSDYETIINSNSLISDIRLDKQFETVKSDYEILNHTFIALRDSNHAMLRAIDEKKLLEEVCRIIVEDCGHELVWIGYAHDNEKKSVEPVAFAGFNEGYISKLNLSWSFDSEYGRGPTGKAIRTGLPSICKDMSIDPDFLPWRDEALKRGYASQLAVPLIHNKKVLGVISIYSKDINPFTHQEIELLVELANDLAFGITTIRTRQELENSQGKLKETENRISKKLESILSPVGDLNDLELEDIIDSHALQSLMDNFYELARIPMAILDNKGKILVGVGWQDVCTNFHRIHHETLYNCIESDTLLTANIPEGEFKLYKCKNGMWDIATPIKIGEQKMGNLFMGQFFFEDEPIDFEHFRMKAQLYGFDEYQYISALEKVPRISSERLEQAKMFFLRLAKMISNLSFSNIKLAKSVEEIDKLADSLRKSKDLLYTTLSSIGDAVISTDYKGKITFMNPVAEKLTGWKYKAAHGKPVKRVLKLIDELTGQEADNPVKRILNTHEAITLPGNTLLVNNEGKEIPIDDSGAPIKDKDGHVLGTVLVFRDITERKKAESEIIKANERFDKVLNMLPHSFIIFDSEWRIVFANNAMLKEVGKTRETQLGGIIWELYPSLTGSNQYKKYMEAAKTKQTQKFVEYSDVTKRWYDYIIFPWEDGVASIVQDITQKTLEEHELRRTEIFIRDIIESIQDAFYVLDSDYRFVYVNNKVLELFGKSGEEIIGQKLFDIFPQSINTPAHNNIIMAMEKQIPVHYEMNSVYLGRWVDVHLYPTSKGLAVYFRDITDKKKTEEILRKALAEAEEGRNTLNALMEYIPMGITIADAPDVNIRMVSHYGQKIMERSESEIAYIPAPEHPSKWGIYHADGVTPGTPDELPLTRATVNGEIVNNEEWIVTRKDGSLVPILCNAAPIRDKDGNVAGGVIGWQDITELKKSEQEIKILARFPAENPNPVIRINKDGILLSFNEASKKLIGIWNCTLGSEIPGFLKKIIDEAFLKNENLIQEFSCYEKTYNFVIVPITQEGYINLYGRDVSELKKAEQELKRLLDLAERNASEIDAMIQSIPHGIYFGNVNGITRCNNEALKMLGAKSLEDLNERIGELGKKFRVRYSKDKNDLVEPENLPFVKALAGQAAALDTWATKADTGEDVLIRGQSTPVIVGGKVIGAVAINMDITREYELIKELKDSEDRLRISERRFKRVLENSPVSVFTMDKELKYTWVYQKMFKMSSFKITNADFIGKTDLDIPALSDKADQLYKMKKTVLNTQASVREIVSLIIDDDEYFIDFTYEPIYDVSGQLEGIAGTAVNVTDQVLYEREKSRQEVAQLIDRSARMASIGAVAGGITHEINQPLNAIRLGVGGIVGWNKKNNTLPEFLLDMVNGIAQATSRIEEIVKTIRSFWVHTGREQIEEVNLNDTIEKVIAFNIQKLSRHKVKILKKLNTDELTVTGNQLRIELVLNNLIANAVHALGKADVEKKQIIISSFVSKGGNPVITVEDNGIGLPDVPEEKLFDPFFTTKASEEGSGLGLAIVKMFLNKYNASITAFNNETGGATFRIEFKNEVPED